MLQNIFSFGLKLMLVMTFAFGALTAQQFPCNLSPETFPEFDTVEEYETWAETNCPELLAWFGNEGEGDQQGDGDNANGPWGDWDPSWDGWDSLPPCLEDAYEIGIEELDSLIVFLEINCPELMGGSDFNDWENGNWNNGNGDWDNGNWDNGDFELPACFNAADSLGLEGDDFIVYLEANCPEVLVGSGFGDWDNGDWGSGDWQWSEEDEMALLVDEFSDCVGEMQFADLDEMYSFIFDNCEDFSIHSYDDNYNGDWDGGFVPDCVLAFDDDFATLQEMIVFLDTNCEDDLAFVIPDCFLTAPIFDNDDDFIQYITDSCGDVFDEDDGNGQAFDGGDMGSLIASYNIKGLSNEGVSQTATGIGSSGLEGSIFPNPAESMVNVKIFEDLIQHYTLIGLEGKIEDAGNGANASRIAIDVRALSTGLYFLRLKTTSGKLFTSPIIVK